MVVGAAANPSESIDQRSSTGTSFHPVGDLSSVEVRSLRLLPMSFATTLDRLVNVSNYAFKYSGHVDWDTIQIPRDPAVVTSPSRSNQATFEQCATWIREPLPAGRSATLRLLLITTVHPLSSNSLSQKLEEPEATQREHQVGVIKRAFGDAGLPEAGFAAYVRTLLSFAQVPSTGAGTREACTRYYYSSPSCALTWSYCATTNETKAILLCREATKSRLVDYIKDVLLPLERFFDHPMLLGYMTVEFSLSELISVLLETSNEILGLEKNTGLSAWDWVNEHEIPGSHVPSNYEYTSKRLSVLSGKVTHIRFRLRTLKEYNNSVLRMSRKHRSGVTDPAAERRCEEIEEILGIVSEYVEVRLHKADSLQERLANQVSGMSNIISQRDTSAMKTVAIVTMAFLPGTFVASFFAMPMLNWDAAADDRIVSRRFWIYWIVTLPLTFLVFALWWAGQKVKERNERKANERAALKQGNSEVVEKVVKRHVFPKGALLV
jgi:CorA-like Mg2+ transporter protein